jgi:uncharacterized protein YgiB involved in biofilm formation
MNKNRTNILRKTALTVFTLIVLTAAAFPGRTVRGDEVTVTSYTCTTVNADDCNGQTWQKQTCTTSYSDGTSSSLSRISLAPWECLSCMFQSIAIEDGGCGPVF